MAMTPATKIPAEKWTRWMNESPTRESIFERWQKTDNGVALLCKDLIVIDVDDENSLDFVIDQCGEAPLCRTSAGFHLHYRPSPSVPVARRIRVGGRPIDLLTGRSLSIVPPLTNNQGVPYKWLNGELPDYQSLPVVTLNWSCDAPRPMTVAHSFDRLERHGSASKGIPDYGRGRYRRQTWPRPNHACGRNPHPEIRADHRTGLAIVSRMEPALRTTVE